MVTQYQRQPHPNIVIAPDQHVIQPQQILLQNDSRIQPVNHKFFFQTPNDFCNYHIKCKEVLTGVAIQLLNEFIGNQLDINFNQNEYIFFHEQDNNKIYQVSREIVSSLVLNKSIYGVEEEQNVWQGPLVFTNNLKQNLKYYLTQHLCHLLNK